MKEAPRGCSFRELGARALSWARGWSRTMTLGRRLAGGGARRTAEGTDPYWIALPVALARRGGRSSRSALLRDVLWGQYCLFLFVRLQDDVFDEQGERGLLYVADQFLVESERAFGRRFSRDDRFWPVFHAALETTTRAILRVDALQARREGGGAALARGYAEVAEIFKVGTSAMGLALGREGDVRALGRFADELSMAGQIVDDLEDLREDLRRGRFNYVAQRVLPPARHTADAALAELAEAFVRGDAADRIVADVRGHLRRAERALDGIHCPTAHGLLERSSDGVRRLERALHRRSVQAAFAPLLAARAG